MLKHASVMCASLLAGGILIAQTPELSWLDRPLSNWNSAGRAVPSPALAPQDETIPEVAKRCTLPALRKTPGETALAGAGWLPFRIFDRQIVERQTWKLSEGSRGPTACAGPPTSMCSCS